jgi:hypothetical protein
MTSPSIQGLSAEKTAAVWQSARELVVWADLVAVSGRSKRLKVIGNKAVAQRRRSAKKAKKARAA